MKLKQLKAQRAKIGKDDDEQCYIIVCPWNNVNVMDLGRMQASHKYHQNIMRALLTLLCTFISILAAADVADVAPSDDAIQTNKFSDGSNTNENHRHDATNRNIRKLWCHGSSSTTPQWHPVYSAGWTNGHCRYNIDCDSPGYASELQCCKFAYAGQISGYCISRLPSPPTTSPTNVGECDVDT